MSAITFKIQTFLGTLLGYGLAVLVLSLVLLKNLFSPFKFVKQIFYTTKREMPACLNDPDLGSHGFIHLDEVKLHYVACGDEDKPLMLCIHGFPEFWYSWRHQIIEFSKDYRVVAVDMRGYGDSDKPSGYKNYVMEKLSADIKQLIPALGYRSCVLLGHDWGGIIVWHFTSMYPDMVEKLVTFNGPHPGVFEKYVLTHFSQFLKSWYVLFFQVPYIPELLMRDNDYGAFKQMLDSLPNQKVSEEDVEAYKYTFSKPGAITGPINYYRGMFVKKLEPLKKIHVPTLVVWGEPDLALATDIAYLAKDHVTNLTVKLVKNSCHFVMVDKPEECNDIVREFLQAK